MPTLSSSTVSVELHDDGTFVIEWPEHATRVGPLHASVTVGGFTEPVPGPWYLDGATAHAGGLDGAPALEVRLEDATPGGVLVTASYAASVDEVVDRFTIAGPTDLDATTRLVEGYDSWAWAGVRRASRPGRSFWRSAFVGPRGALTVSARTAHRLVTAIEWDAEIGRAHV